MAIAIFVLFSLNTLSSLVPLLAKRRLRRIERLFLLLFLFLCVRGDTLFVCLLLCFFLFLFEQNVFCLCDVNDFFFIVGCFSSVLEMDGT